MQIDFNKTKTRDYIDLVNNAIKERGLLAHVITLGCQQNEADSEKIRAMAVRMGYGITDDAKEASLIVVNTCAIRDHAEQKALSIVGNFKSLKMDNKDLIISLCGCMAAEKVVAEKVKRSYPQISFTLEPTQLHRFPELIYKTMETRKRSFVLGSEDYDVIEGIGCERQSDFKAWVSIMYGCNNFCSYCIVPYVRGRERSRSSDAILDECRELISRGYKEITLLGQNVNSYKSDITFARLMSEIAEIEGDFILRFMTSHPKDVSDELIEVMGKYTGKIAPVFHLPLQSGSNKILKDMNRTYDREKYLATVEKLRLAVPDICLTSDIIVGFPTETEEDFEDTMQMLRTVRFDMVYSFIYSPRTGTRAAKMPSCVTAEQNKERMSRLLEMQCNISHEINEKYVGDTLRVLVDSVTESDNGVIYNGRTDKNKLVHFEAENCEIGKFTNVKISKAGAFDLFGVKI